MDNKYWSYLHDHGLDIGRHAGVGFVTAQNVLKCYRDYVDNLKSEQEAALKAAVDAYILKHGNICIGCPLGWCLGCIPEVEVDEIPDANRSW